MNFLIKATNLYIEIKKITMHEKLLTVNEILKMDL